MKDFSITIDEIKDLMNTFGKNKLDKLVLKNGEFSLELEGTKYTQAGTAVASQPAAAQILAQPQESEASAVRGNIATAPIVGTFYAAPAPDKAPYISVGDKVQKGDVLFIIESMKLMNEVTSDFSGTVTDILVENGTPVEYGQPVVVIE